MTVNFALICGSLLLGSCALASGIGISICGKAAIGAWKKCFLTNKPAPMIVIAFAANPVTQTFYGFILMRRLMDVAADVAVTDINRMLVYSGYAFAAGVALFCTAIIQGKIAACAIDALCETRKGFAHYYTVLGAAETVALFAMVLTMVML
jgi:V/A-type H+-transporting ATPase subunit K